VLSRGLRRFLLVEFLTAETLAQSRERDPRARLVSIALAGRHHKSFLKRLQHFDLVAPCVKAIMGRMEEGGSASPQARFEFCMLYVPLSNSVCLTCATCHPRAFLSASSLATRHNRCVALQVLRNEKIEQKQQERAIEQQIERLRAQRQPCDNDGDGDASPSGMLSAIACRHNETLYCAQCSTSAVPA
jgi:TAP42-like family